jgi:predicted nucleic-acid-binding protein
MAHASGSQARFADMLKSVKRKEEGRNNTIFDRLFSVAQQLAIANCLLMFATL